MRIAFIGQKGIPTIAGGVEKHVEEVAVRMAELGHEVFVYVRNNYTDKGLKEYKGVKLIHLPSIPTKNLDAISHTFLATLHALFHRYDVIHFQAIGPSSLAWIIRIFKRRTALVATFHCQDYFHQKWGLPARLYLKLGEYMTCKAPHQTIVVSETLEQYVAQKYGRKVIFISNGADVEYTPKTQALNRWGLKEGKYILSVGRLIRHKGIHYLIEAFKKLEDTGRLANGMKLVIVGDGFHTDDYVRELRSLSKDRSNIIFTGSQNGGSLEQLFSHAYLFVQPSESEGRSIALIEAMGYGLTTLVSNIPENLATIRDKGYAFENRNIEDLGAKLSYLLSQPDAVANNGKEAAKFAKAEYSWDSKVKRTLDVYEDIIFEKKIPKLYAWKSKKI